MTSTDLADFGASERKELCRLLNAWREQGLPIDFEQTEVIPMMNKNSGFVFLTNSEYETVMLNGNDLERFYHCFECGDEGFSEDINWNKDKNCCGDCAGDEEEE